MDQQEQFFYCPYCAQSISVLIDLSVPAQNYIEDCEVCCRPMEIIYEVSGGELNRFEAKPS